MVSLSFFETSNAKGLSLTLLWPSGAVDSCKPGFCDEI